MKCENYQRLKEADAKAIAGQSQRVQLCPVCSAWHIRNRLAKGLFFAIWKVTGEQFICRKRGDTIEFWCESEEENPWRSLPVDQFRKIFEEPRGTAVKVSRTERLLWSTDDQPEADRTITR